MVSSGLVGLGLRLRVPDVSQHLKQPPLKMPATDAGETSRTRNPRPRPSSPEDTIYIDAGREGLNQYKGRRAFKTLTDKPTGKEDLSVDGRTILA